MFETIDNFTTSFVNIIDRGFGFVQGDVYFLTETLILFNILFLGIAWTLGDNSYLARVWFFRVLGIGFWVFLIENFQYITGVIIDSAALYGLRAGGSSLTVTQLFQPSNILRVGWDTVEPIQRAVSNTSGLSFFSPSSIVKMFILFISFLVLLFAFFYLAIQMFVGLIEFKLLSLASFILVPFALFDQTSNISYRVINLLIAAAVRVCILGIVIGIGGSLFSSIVSVDDSVTDLSFADIFVAIAGAYIIVALAKAIPNLANSLIWGGTSLSAEGHVSNSINFVRGASSAEVSMYGKIQDYKKSQIARDQQVTKAMTKTVEKMNKNTVNPHGNPFAKAGGAPGDLSNMDGGKSNA